MSYLPIGIKYNGELVASLDEDAVFHCLDIEKTRKALLALKSETKPPQECECYGYLITIMEAL